MSALTTIVAALSAVTWIYLILARGAFWHLKSDRADGDAEFSGCIAAVVPARNEAELIGGAITSLLSQSRAITVFLVDDESTDGTAEAALRAAEKAGKAGELVVLQSQPLPSGWTGKLWAMHQGIAHARALNPEWLMLTDADVIHDPETAANLACIASHGHYDLVSFMVKLHCQSLAEKLLIPAFVYFFFMLYPPDWIRDPRHSTAGAAGGCMLVRSEALERAGGLEAIRGALIDDCSLARLLKQRGGRLWLGLTDHSRSLRRYETFADIGRMVSRTAFNQLNHSSLLLLGTVAGHGNHLSDASAVAAEWWQAGARSGRCSMGGYDDHLLDHGAILPAELGMGFVSPGGGSVLSGRHDTFCIEVLEWQGWRLERESARRPGPPNACLKASHLSCVGEC